MSDDYKFKLGLALAREEVLIKRLEELEAPKRHDDVLVPFVELMRAELCSNSHKVDREGWLGMSVEAARCELYHHQQKLDSAIMSCDATLIKEHAADVANCAMMVLDVCGGCLAVRKKSRNDIFSAMREESQARNEDNDCSVISLAYALRVPYDVAHLIMGKAGRKHQSGGSMVAAARIIEPGRLVQVKGLPYPYITLSEFCRTHSVGRYWVGVTGHALVVENGRVCDYCDKVRRRVDMAWRVYEKPTEKQSDDQ